MPESLCNFIKKETLAQVFSGEYLRNILEHFFFYKTPLVAASILNSIGRFTSIPRQWRRSSVSIVNFEHTWFYY